MCGIAGVVRFDGAPVDPARLEGMAAALAHRGPDGTGVHVDGPVGLAHRRLAVIDPAGGRQPFLLDGGRLALTYNGEVYDYVELREALGGSGFVTSSDTEVLLRAWDAWGPDCLGRLRGMFAFALWDRARGRLYVVRDRVGIKPLYWRRDGARLAFASELPALLDPGERPALDPAGVSGYFRYQYVPAPGTIYAGIHKLRPGHLLEVDPAAGTVRERRWWELRVTVEDDERPAEAWQERLDALLDDTLRLYVRSDVPSGAFLSGGVDSSLVTALMARRTPWPVRTFSVGFEERAHSELPFAAEAASRVGSDHRELLVTAAQAAEVLPRLCAAFGEPFGDSSAVPTWHVSRAAAAEVKVVLSGDGGDELFGGYPSYATTLRRDRRWPRRPGELLLRAGAAVGPAWLRASARRARQRRLRPLHDAQRQSYDDAGLRTWLRPELAPAPAVEVELALPPARLDGVTPFQVDDFKTYLVDDVLTKVDRMSMAHSLEVRVPLLDHRVVELAFSLPLSLKLRRDAGRIDGKWLLKRSAARFFPAAFLDRPKRGFGIPVVEWLRGPLRPLVDECLRAPGAPIRGWVRPEALDDLTARFQAGADGLGARVWHALAFDLWLRAGGR